MAGFQARRNRRDGISAVSRRGGARACFAAASSLLVAASLLAGPARAQEPDWEAVAEVPVIEILTTDADGDPRETKVWFVLIDGQPYLRTNASRWLENLRRDPDCILRIEGHEYRTRVEEVPGDAMVEAVDRASRDKYGWQERVIHVFRMRTPQILRVHPRPTGD